MKYKTLAILAALVLLSSIAPVGVYAEEENEEEEDENGLGMQEGEGSSPFSGTILYVTIGAIIAAIGYTAFKIARSKKATAKLR